MNGIERHYALEVYRDGALIFHDNGGWLYPLFALETFLEEADLDPASLTVSDKVVGRAAALLMIRMGVGRVEADLLSELGRSALEHYGMDYSYQTLVPRIQCKTESLLRDELDVSRAYRLLRARAEQSGELSR